MAQLKAKEIVEGLANQGFIDKTKASEAEDAIKNLKLSPETYDTAVWFLGIATVILAIGSMVLVGLDKASEAVWGALGAGIGGLAGIFTGKQ